MSESERCWAHGTLRGTCVFMGLGCLYIFLYMCECVSMWKPTDKCLKFSTSCYGGSVLAPPHICAQVSPLSEKHQLWVAAETLGEEAGCSIMHKRSTGALGCVVGHCGSPDGVGTSIIFFPCAGLRLCAIPAPPHPNLYFPPSGPHTKSVAQHLFFSFFLLSSDSYWMSSWLST